MEARSIASLLGTETSPIFERRSFPHFLKFSSSFDKQNEVIYTTTMLAAIASLALTRSTAGLELELKQELERWKLVGDSTINFAVVLEIWLTSSLSESVKTMNQIKIDRIKQESVAKAMSESNWPSDYLQDSQ
jgi:hypothetical protein